VVWLGHTGTHHYSVGAKNARDLKTQHEIEEKDAVRARDGADKQEAQRTGRAWAV
jgi:hypothetical protein